MKAFVVTKVFRKDMQDNENMTSTWPPQNDPINRQILFQSVLLVKCFKSHHVPQRWKFPSFDTESLTNGKSLSNGK
jgi:hypothetical protein